MNPAPPVTSHVHRVPGTLLASDGRAARRVPPFGENRGPAGPRNAMLIPVELRQSACLAGAFVQLEIRVPTRFPAVRAAHGVAGVPYWTGLAQPNGAAIARATSESAGRRRIMKRTIARVLAADPIARLWSPLLRGRVTVFTLHRFAQPEYDIAGHDSSLLRATLARLRRERYDLLSLEDAIGRARDPNASGRAIAFTVDDGYQDIAQVGAEIFLEYDCPLSIFLTTGFIDGRLWHWWNQIEFICLATDRPSLDVVLAETRVTVVLDDRVDRRALVVDLRERCKQVSEQAKLEFIARLAESAGVEIPARPPAQYRGLSWDDVRGLERRGFRFGPHGVSHAVLARTSDGDAAREIRESWERLKAETAYPMPVFAYPNGTPGDYGLKGDGIGSGMPHDCGCDDRARLRVSVELRAGLSAALRASAFPVPG